MHNLGHATSTAKRILTKEKLDGQLAGQSVGPSPLLVMEEKEMKQKIIAFHDSNVMNVNIDKLISMIGKLSMQHRQA